MLMIWVDYVIVGVIVLSALVSLIRGFIREAVSLLTWVVAFWVSWTFFRDLAEVFAPWFDTPSVRLGISFVILLLLTLIIGAVVNFFLGQLVDRTGLTGTDRLFGVVFGVARGVLLVAIIVLLAGLTPLPEDSWWKESQLIVYLQELAIWMRGFLPPDIAESFRFS